jgi:crotonobetainyl-CoA:carnitine CoA-transferase CaiB-like acyl-CoA transferase
MSDTQAAGSALPLAGVRVLDFGRYIAGPYCAAILAEYGAEVIRIDKRGGSEDRFMWPLAEGCDGGAQFLQVNRNKLSLTLDPMTDRGREIVRKLVATADVIIANVPPQTLSAMRLDIDSLRAVKPDIILVLGTAYGTRGPFRDRVGFDSVGQVMSGAAYLSGTHERPARFQGPWVDFGTAAHLACGTLLALMARQKTGKGQVVEGALLGTALTVNDAVLVEQAVIAKNRVPSGNRGQANAPTDLFRTRDGWIACHVIGEPLFKRWARLMGEEHWQTDPRFRSDAERGDNRDSICERMGQWCAGRTTQEAIDELGEAMIPAAPVLTPQGALDHPAVRGMELFQQLDYPGLPGPAPVAKVPLWLSETRGRADRAPTAGEHTDGVLAQLGYSVADIEELRRTRVI